MDVRHAPVGSASKQINFQCPRGHSVITSCCTIYDCHIEPQGNESRQPYQGHDLAILHLLSSQREVGQPSPHQATTIPIHNLELVTPQGNGELNSQFFEFKRYTSDILRGQQGRDLQD